MDSNQPGLIELLLLVDVLLAFFLHESRSLRKASREEDDADPR